MRRLRLAAIIIVTIFLFGLTLHPATAYPPCESTMPPDGSQGVCGPRFLGVLRARTKSRVPFVWLRSAPASDAPVVATVFPTGYANLHVDQQAKWDGQQWWWQVSPIPNPKRISGWVEQSGITSYPDWAYYIARWQTPARAVLLRGADQVNVRDSPYLKYSKIADVLRAGTTFTLSNSIEPSWDRDSRRWWWFIEYESPAGPKSGWVEQRYISVTR